MITSSNDFIEEKTAKLKNKLENISQKYSELDFLVELVEWCHGFEN